jgi:hypothetical protein
MISLDISDCLEFLTKYHASRWQEEMKETHFCYTEKETDFNEYRVQH